MRELNLEQFSAIYTAFIYNGPKFVYNINSKLAEMIKKDGYENISQAVGVI